MTHFCTKRRASLFGPVLGLIMIAASSNANAQLEEWRPLLRKMYADSILHLNVKGTQEDKTSTSWDGSGFIIHPRGFAITAAHVVIGDGKFVKRDVTVRTRSKANGRSWTAQVIKVDVDLDIALVKLPDPSDAGVRWIPVPLTDSNNLNAGEEVVTLAFSSDANTDGLESYGGRVSSAMQKFGWFPIADTAMNPGNSGAPVFSRDL